MNKGHGAVPVVMPKTHIGESHLLTGDATSFTNAHKIHFLARPIMCDFLAYQLAKEGRLSRKVEELRPTVCLPGTIFAGASRCEGSAPLVQEVAYSST